LSHGSANSLNEKLVHHEWADLVPHSREIPHQENYDLSSLEEGLSESMYRKLTSSSLGHEAPDAERSRYEAVLSIGGMTCASCTGGIDRGLSGLPYVESVNVTLMTNSAKVVFSGNENLGNIVKAVEDLGYDCSVERCELKDQAERPDRTQSQRRLVMLRIDGMFCNHCPTRVVDAIKANYSDQITVEHVPTIKDPVIKINYLPNPPNFTIRSMIATIDTLEEPFSTNIHTPPSIEQRSQQTQRHEQQRLLKRLVGTFTVAIPTLLIGVIWMSLIPASNNVRRFFEQPVWAGTVTRTNWALFILATPVFFLAADVFHLRAIKEIRVLWRRGSKVPVFQRFYRFGSMNLLVSLGTSIAYFASVAVLAIDARAKKQTARSSSTYFDSVVFLTFFILCGRYLEAYSKAKTGDAVGMLGDLRPREAVLVTSSTSSSAPPLPMDGMSESGASGEHKQSRSSTQRINASLLEVGDVVIVSHGSSPPADGIIVEGSTNFNESSLTGESRAVPKTQGETVFAGAINIGNPILVRVTEIGGTSMLDQIVAVVREGQTKRAPVERVVEFLVGYFVPVITALAVLTFVIWLSLGLSGSLAHKYLDDQQGGWAFWSLEFAIAVFVVACPCGIALAAPTALFVGGGLAASHGILVRGGGEAFQEASNIDAVVFDKTGTLTEGGDLKVTDHEVLAQDEEVGVAWSITKSLEESSSHPLARALLQLATPKSPHQIITVSIKEEPGLGLCGTFTANSSSPDTATYEAALGSEALIASLTPTPAQLTYFTNSTLSTWKSQSKSVALLAIRKVTLSATANPWTLAATFAISDPIRPTALPTISALQKIGIPVYMLTGDNPITAAAVASRLSIPSDHVFAGILPTEKASKIQWLQEHGPKRASSTSWFRSRRSAAKRAIVAFVGDGINDAPALTTADVSISLSSASDIAMHSSSFILLSSSLTSVLTLFQLSERVFRRVKFNFGWAVIYNVILIPVAAGCFFRVSRDGWRLGPVWGSAAMALSSLTVVLSSLALRWEGKRAEE
jgi:heavy metal translocating P-type ATPase